MPGFWSSKTDEEVKTELFSQINIQSFDFIGRYREDADGFAYFDNIRLPNFSPLPKLKSNMDDRLVNARVIPNKKDLKKGNYYNFSAKVIAQGKRLEDNNDFIFAVSDENEISEYLPEAKLFTEAIFERFNRADSANNNDISKALNTITFQINKKPETFIYELLQNADDNAGNKDVTVTFFITAKYLLVSHDGEPFKFNNVFAICSVNAEDKSEDIEKIGFKGIGFKSVFKDNDWVFIKSGEYNFRYDHSKYSVEKPWQLMPVWTPINDSLEISIRNNDRFLSQNVAIALKPKNDNLDILTKYSKTLELFNDDRILLFLKHVKRVHVSLKNKEKINCNKSEKNWKTRDFVVKIREDINIWLNEQIRNNNQEVPSKYQDIDKFKISFAYKIQNGKIVVLKDSNIFNYLPLTISLGFPFIVNADFIPDGDREELYLNTWNEYLMVEIGKHLPKFISTLSKSRFDGMNLLPEIKIENSFNTKWKQLYDWFLLGYVESIKGNETNPAIQFIPTQSGTLETLSNILIDETGLADLLKEDFFILTGITGKLIHNEVGEGIQKVKVLITEYEQGTVYDIEDLKTTLTTLAFQEWLKIPAKNFKLIQHFNSKAELKSLLETEIIILSESKKLHKSSSLFNGIPNEITFLTTEKISSELSSLLSKNNISLKLTEFEPVKFFKDNILGKQISINASLNDETNLLNFWKFVFDNWTLFENETTIKDSLKHFEVLCKSETEHTLSKKVISSAYLSAEFNAVNEIESVVKDISPEEVFISDKYIDTKREAETWRKIFKQAAAITDLQKVIEVLLPELPTIEAPKHLEIAKQIFKFWKDHSNKLTEAQIDLIKTNLKIKCVDKEFRKSTDCFISDHYNNNQLIASWLPSIELANQVAQEYAPKTNQVAEWKNFFALIGCVELKDKQNVFDAKLDFIIISQDKFKEKHFEILKSISDLHKAKNDNGLNFDFENVLSQIKLQTSNDEWHLANSIHLSSSYKPKLNLQNDETINSTLLFLNEKYLPNEIEKYFLTEVGVNDSFKFYMSELKRNEIPTLYREKFESINSYIVQNAAQYGSQHILQNHIDLNYKSLLSEYKYSEIFWKEVKKPSSKHLKFLFQESTYRTAFNSVTFENYLVNYLKQNPTLPNQESDLKKPTELFSFLLSEYITDKNDLQKFDLTEIHFNNDQSKSLENILGVQKLLSQKHCIELLSRTKSRISHEQITALQIVKILTGYTPTDDEKAKLFLLNRNLEWKPLNKLFHSTEEQFQIEPSQNLHEDFHSIADSFGIQELSEDNLVLKTKPKTPTVTDEIETFFRSKAKFIAFKIDHLNYDEIESGIIEKLTPFEFYKVTSISKVFPELSPIYTSEEFEFYQKESNEIYYKGNWRFNSQFLEWLLESVIANKIQKVFLQNVISESDEKIIEALKFEFGSVPIGWKPGHPPVEHDSFWTELRADDKKFIHDIIGYDYPLDEQLDANTTARIKTLMKIKNEYALAEIKNEAKFLKAGADEIFVRSAQNGLLYLDVYDWGKLNEANVRLAVYTKGEIEIYNTQEELIQFTKPQNKFGILRMPTEYSIRDYNSLDNITDKGNWHFVFIVDEKAKSAQSYKEVMNLDDYNF